jgi:ATP-dependent RNA helicase RhlE
VPLEIELLVPPSGVSSGLISKPEIKELNRMNESFRSLGVRPQVVDALAARGIETPFPIQQLVLPEALAGVDVLAKSPTGSGKTLAFGLALVERTKPGSGKPTALVLVPTRELAAQVAEELRAPATAAGLRIEAVYGGVPVGRQAKRAQRAEILVATPGRMKDLADRNLVSLAQIEILVLDEADRMLDMGFRPQVDAIVRRLPRKRQTMFFSATLDGEVGDLARAYTHDPGRFDVAPQEAHAEAQVVDHAFVPVTSADKLDVLVEHLSAADGLALVFVRTKRGADRLARRLSQRGIAAAAMHGDLQQSRRERTLEQFRTGRIPTLVATELAARGLDMVEITHVINYDPPEDDTSYLHRVGRTGRAGRGGAGVTLVLPEQQADVGRVAARAGRRAEFEGAGLRPVRPKLLYTSRRGRRSRW